MYTYFIQQYGQRASLSVQCTLGNTLNILEASVCILKRAKRAYKSSLAVIYKIHKKIFQPAHLHIFFLFRLTFKVAHPTSFRCIYILGLKGAIHHFEAGLAVGTDDKEVKKKRIFFKKM